MLLIEQAYAPVKVKLLSPAAVSALEKLPAELCELGDTLSDQRAAVSVVADKFCHENCPLKNKIKKHEAAGAVPVPQQFAAGQHNQ